MLLDGRDVHLKFGQGCLEAELMGVLSAMEMLMKREQFLNAIAE